ncbi:hypothetical protein EDI_161580 [Entamoeba dispar SAW760]|uniref:Uncharacterized protein n=1 Tax=Entamoeba dispar (strain ATCC PRA-260 / SAW760) TaxID=370354 RepID=B0EUR9_ENTDS|nr:uncharacterized protein EDI_161580 [Entamoeba dispar SAW760]EDR21713.1 hypothetical protein EDI_161580 [Entamoeba dispar SAW760]|eukprot:EDR21713.1 hypothetical protein EDI_161580 [Entamoeba dispar SAW760]
MSDSERPIVSQEEQPKEEKDTIVNFQESDDDDEIIDIEPIHTTTTSNNWKKVPLIIIIKTALWVKEKIQQTIDLSIYLFVTPSKVIVSFMQKPLVKKITTGITSVALFGVCVYAFGYIPFQYVKQSKALQFH